MCCTQILPVDPCIGQIFRLTPGYRRAPDCATRMTPGLHERPEKRGFARARDADQNRQPALCSQSVHGATLAFPMLATEIQSRGSDTCLDLLGRQCAVPLGRSLARQSDQFIFTIDMQLCCDAQASFSRRVYVLHPDQGCLRPVMPETTRCQHGDHGIDIPRVTDAGFDQRPRRADAGVTFFQHRFLPEAFRKQIAGQSERCFHMIMCYGCLYCGPIGFPYEKWRFPAERVCLTSPHFKISKIILFDLTWITLRTLFQQGDTAGLIKGFPVEALGLCISASRGQSALCAL